MTTVQLRAINGNDEDDGYDYNWQGARIETRDVKKLTLKMCSPVINNPVFSIPSRIDRAAILTTYLHFH